MNFELLHATDSQGRYVKTSERKELIREIRNYSQKNGEAPLAVPVVHLVLINSDGNLHLVQRGDKPENPFMWDKTVGGHVVTEERQLSRHSFDENVQKEMAEEIGVSQVVIAKDSLDFRQRLASNQHDLSQTAVIRLIDYDPWMGSVCRMKEGVSWLKRGNTAVYCGVYDGEIRFVDGEAVNHRLISKAQLQAELREQPWNYADGLRIFMQRYYAFL
ncbi:MAG: NUDIX domain-containing protein [Magnetococcales bacterium]|nr:NUDIX domain-containing protein [Magnetococcales bacterium]